jgi:tRNA (adenine57-N1/adenine58-N1)-methyltransferase
MTTDDIIKEGDAVILYFSITNLLLVPSIKAEDTTHNGYGFFYHSDIIGKRFGSKIEPKNGSENPRPMHVLRVTPELFTLSIPHRTQIIYHADISAILMGLNIVPGSVVVEAGTGSASLSFSIAHKIAPSGRLFTFEVDHARAEHNRQLLHAVTDPGVVTLEERDVVEKGFPETIVADAVFLDLPSPWLAIAAAGKALKDNGRLCTFSPSIEQVSKNVDAMKANKFHEIRTVEVMLKPWGLDLPKEAVTGKKRKRAAENAASFQLPMRGHTSYLTFAIKQLSDEGDFPKPTLSLADVTRMADSVSSRTPQPVDQ